MELLTLPIMKKYLVFVPKLLKLKQNLKKILLSLMQLQLRLMMLLLMLMLTMMKLTMVKLLLLMPMTKKMTQLQPILLQLKKKKR